MANDERRAAYASLWVSALALGWIEASAVLYLREIYAGEIAVHATSHLPNLQVPLASLPDPLVRLELVREACTLALLGAVAWLAGRQAAARLGAFLASFGIADLTYHAVLRLASGWPGAIGTWDVLFLVPSPWAAPVWAHVTVATLLFLAGSYLFWTADRPRHYRWMDAGILAASAGLTTAAFLAGWAAAADGEAAGHVPLWLFWSGVALGTAWFMRVERRVRRTGAAPATRRLRHA